MSTQLPSPFTNQPAPPRAGPAGDFPTSIPQLPPAATRGRPPGRKPRRPRGSLPGTPTTAHTIPQFALGLGANSANATYTPTQWTTPATTLGGGTGTGTSGVGSATTMPAVPISSAALLSGMSGYETLRNVPPIPGSSTPTPALTRPPVVPGGPTAMLPPMGPPTSLPGTSTLTSIPAPSIQPQAGPSTVSIPPATPITTTTTTTTTAPPMIATSSIGQMRPPVTTTTIGATQSTFRVPAQRMEEEEAGEEDEMLPAMADDDYSAQLSFQTQSKDNLKILMENLSAQQYDRFEAYRRHALNKAAVRKLIQQTLGQQVSQPVAQVVAGFGKVFVGEIIEKAREVQEKRGDRGALSPDHLREAYRAYQLESGRVGAARPLRSKKLFVR